MELKRTPNFSDAAAISIGAIIGEGILAVLGVALGYAGTAAVVRWLLRGRLRCSARSLSECAGSKSIKLNWSQLFLRQMTRGWISWRIKRS